METFFFGNRSSGTVLIQIADGHDISSIEHEISLIQKLSGKSDFLLAAVKSENPGNELSPWAAPPVFGNRPFGGGADKTLSFLEYSLIPSLSKNGQRRFFLGGYSLAGLFALWAAYQTKVFSGIAAVSPSAWFLNFEDYARTHKAKSGKIYLSLGTKEENTRNPELAKVGNAIREIYNHIAEDKISCTLEWNPGNHFQDPEQRTAKGFAWLLGRQTL